MNLIDSHCHLDYFGDDIPDVIQRALLNGVTCLQTISTKVDEFDFVKKIAHKNPSVYCSIGVHPCESRDLQDLSEDQIIDLLLKAADDPKVIGIGETGLDYYHHKDDLDHQKIQHKCFWAHIEVAKQLDLPLIIHTRDADEDTLGFLSSDRAKGARGVIHCFTGSKKMAAACLDLGYYISFSGIVTFKNAKEIQEIATTIPENRFLIETDAPYLAPSPHRGERNEPAWVYHVADYIAKLRQTDIAFIADLSSKNFKKLFNKVSL